MRVPSRIVGAVTALLVTTAAVRTTSSKPPEVTREVVAVYFGTEGTDAQSGMVAAVHEMRAALQRQAAANGQRFIARGVSLEPTVAAGLRHLERFDAFDEVSLGGNWTNSAVVRYFGGDMNNHQRAAIPQIVLLEREVRQGRRDSLSVGPEREIGRFIGTAQISTWVGRGAPLPR